MKEVRLIFMLFMLTALWINCRVTRPMFIERPMRPVIDSVSHPVIRISSLSIDTPVTITMPGHDTTSKIELKITTPKKLVFPVFDTTFFNTYVDRYFTEYKKTLYANEQESHETERLALILQIKSLVADKNRLMDSIMKLEVQCTRMEPTVNATQALIYDFPKWAVIIVLLVVIGSSIRYYVYKRMLQNALKKH